MVYYIQYMELTRLDTVEAGSMYTAKFKQASFNCMTLKSSYNEQCANAVYFTIFHYH
jgi:hypothetical protein